jgi:hypothetical protein
MPHPSRRRHWVTRQISFPFRPYRALSRPSNVRCLFYSTDKALAKGLGILHYRRAIRQRPAPNLDVQHDMTRLIQIPYIGSHSRICWKAVEGHFTDCAKPIQLRNLTPSILRCLTRMKEGQFEPSSSAAILSCRIYWTMPLCQMGRPNFDRDEFSGPWTFGPRYYCERTFYGADMDSGLF